MESIRSRGSRCEILLVEGAGGLLVPVGEGWTIADLITALECPVIVVAANRLGVLNHTLLTVEALKRRGCDAPQVVLMGTDQPDGSAASNAGILREILGSARVLEVPYGGQFMGEAASFPEVGKKIHKTLAEICEAATFCAPLRRLAE